MGRFPSPSSGAYTKLQYGSTPLADSQVFTGDPVKFPGAKEVSAYLTLNTNTRPHQIQIQTAPTSTGPWTDQYNFNITGVHLSSTTRLPMRWKEVTGDWCRALITAGAGGGTIASSVFFIAYGMRPIDAIANFVADKPEVGGTLS